MLKDQFNTLRNDLRKFEQGERIVRDFLLLCLPQAVVAQHQKGVDEMRVWIEEGWFEADRQVYPFHFEHFKQAVQKMWAESHFVPASRSDCTRPLRYLKQIMISLAQKEEQARQSAGIQVERKAALTKERKTAFAPNGNLSWIRRTIAHCEAIKEGFDIQPVLGRLRNALQAPDIISPYLQRELRDLLDALIVDYVTQHETDLRAEVELWYLEHKDEWGAATYEAAIQEGMKERVKEQFDLPKI